MDYLERNAAVFEEMRRVVPDLKRGGVVGRSPKTTTTSLGSYNSNIYQGSLHILLKERGGFPMDLDLVRTLTAIHLISSNIPKLLPKLPFFSGLLANPDGGMVGVITEDFSEGGQYRVREVFESWLDPTDQLLNRLQMVLRMTQQDREWDDFANMMFMIEKQDRRVIRIGDFDKALIRFSANERVERLDWGGVYEDVQSGRYTLKLPYPLI